MKKLIPLLAVIGGAAAFAAYKMKKDEQKKIIDLDEDMLQDETIHMDEEETLVEEEPISDPKSCCEDVKHAVDEAVEATGEFVDSAVDTAKELADEAKEEVKKAAKDAKEVFPNLLADEIEDLKNKTRELMDKMKEAGDIHEHERPVEHSVVFENEEDAEHFKRAIINRGYVITAGDNKNELNILHITPLDEVKLVANVLFIVNEAHKYHGTYTGWTSKIAG